MSLYRYNEQNPVQEINLKKGKYLFELWGAQGGQGCSDSKKLTQYYGGRGAYVYGKVVFTHSQRLFLYIGRQGQDPLQCNFRYNGKGGFKAPVPPSQF